MSRSSSIFSNVQSSNYFLKTEMSFDESFLSPRDLLTNSKTFCCDGPSFFKLQQAIQATQNLPYNDSGLDYRVPFTEQGRQEVK